ESFQPCKNVAAQFERVFLQFFPLDDFKHRLADGAHDRIASKSVKVDSLRKHIGNQRSGDHGGQGATVANALGHRDDVGDHALGLEAPEVAAHAAEAGLNLIGNADAARPTNVLINVLEITVREHHDATDALDGFSDERRHLPW